MNIRQDLRNDIKNFNLEADSNQVNDNKWLVEKSAYMNLINRIFQLTMEDFETKDKFNFFSEFLIHDERKKKLIFIGNSFLENHLDQNSFLMMSNFLESIREKLK